MNQITNQPFTPYPLILAILGGVFKVSTKGETFKERDQVWVFWGWGKIANTFWDFPTFTGKVVIL